MLPLKDTVRSRSFPLVTYALILANVLIFVFEASLSPRAFEAFLTSFGMVPRRLLDQPDAGQVVTVFTSMFLHGGWLHVISNMWALFIFGDNIEDRMGHFRFFVFYLICGMGAAAAHVLADPSSAVPVVGASGALSGVMGAYLLLFPRARVVALVPVFLLPWFVEVPAVVFIGLWFITQIFNGVLSLSGGAQVGAYGGVAWWAHVGGFLVGLVLAKAFARRYLYRQFSPDEHWPW